MERFIRVNGKDFSVDEVARALGVKGLGEPVQVALCQRVDDGVLVAKGAFFDKDAYPGIDVELELPVEKDSMPVMISRTEQPRPDGEVGKVRTFGYSRADEYFMYFDVDTRSDKEVDGDDARHQFHPSLVVSGSPSYHVEVYEENTYVKYKGDLSAQMKEQETAPEVKMEDLKVGMVGNIKGLPELKKELRGKAFEVVDFSPSGIYPIIKIEGMDGTYSAHVSHLENVHLPLGAKLDNAIDKAGVSGSSEMGKDFGLD